MAVGYNPSIITDGLTYFVDPANTRSYSGSGLTINGLIGGIGGTLVNGVGFTSTNNGNFVFDGTNDFINIPDSNLLAFGTNPFSIDFWIYSTYVHSGGALYRTILSSYDNYNGVYQTYFYLGLFNNGSTLNNLVSFLNSASGNLMGSLGTNINTNQWTYVAFTRNGNGLNSYKNGVLASTQASANDFSGTRNARIGGGVDQISTFQGSISALKIYNRALSAQEILQNFNATRYRYGI